MRYFQFDDMRLFARVAAYAVACVDYCAEWFGKAR